MIFGVFNAGTGGWAHIISTSSCFILTRSMYRNRLSCIEIAVLEINEKLEIKWMCCPHDFQGVEVYQWVAEAVEVWEGVHCVFH